MPANMKWIWGHGPVWIILALALGTMGAHKKAAPNRGVSLGDGGFDLSNLPKGKSVTIPRPATTFVSLGDRVTFTATDMPQTLSFRPVNLRKGPVAVLNLAIIDPSGEGVQNVSLRPGTPFLYNFKHIGPVTVLSDSPAVTLGGDGLHLQVESDKPLDIAH